MNIGITNKNYSVMGNNINKVKNNSKNNTSFKGWTGMPWGFHNAPKGSNWSDVINYCWKDEAGIDTDITTFPRGASYTREGDSSHFVRMSDKLKERGLLLKDMFEKSSDSSPEGIEKANKLKNASDECLLASETAGKKAVLQRGSDLQNYIGWQKSQIRGELSNRDRNFFTDYDKIDLCREKISEYENEMKNLPEINVNITNI